MIHLEYQHTSPQNEIRNNWMYLSNEYIYETSKSNNNYHMTVNDNNSLMKNFTDNDEYDNNLNDTYNDSIDYGDDYVDNNNLKNDCFIFAHANDIQLKPDFVPGCKRKEIQYNSQKNNNKVNIQKINVQNEFNTLDLTYNLLNLHLDTSLEKGKYKKEYDRYNVRSNRIKQCIKNISFNNVKTNFINSIHKRKYTTKRSYYFQSGKKLIYNLKHAKNKLYNKLIM
jgi:ribosome-associated toxin RatA of RatAB toxin-antitoxin module